MKCKCGKVWLWDWCADSYRYTDGEFVDTEEWDDDGLDHKLLVHTCDCGKLNSVQISCENGGGVMNTPEWKDIDWESDEHSWPDQ